MPFSFIQITKVTINSFMKPPLLSQTDLHFSSQSSHTKFTSKPSSYKSLWLQILFSSIQVTERSDHRVTLKVGVSSLGEVGSSSPPLEKVSPDARLSNRTRLALLPGTATYHHLITETSNKSNSQWRKKEAGGRRRQGQGKTDRKEGNERKTQNARFALLPETATQLLAAEAHHNSNK